MIPLFEFKHHKKKRVPQKPGTLFLSRLNREFRKLKPLGIF
jgi:hypothetical protein